MKIYFTAAVSQLKDYGDAYKRIVAQCEKLGYKVQSSHILEKQLTEVFDDSDEEKVSYYKKFLSWLNSSDLVVAEASFPSTVNVGHEISVALEKGKPVIVLHMRGKSPVFLEGIESDKLFIQEYDDSSLEHVVLDAIDYAADQQDSRFNFFISPKHQHYLDWVSRKKMVPRAVHLRKLLETDIAENKDYQAELVGEKTDNK